MSISADNFKDVLRLFPAGVTVVTVKSGERIHGLTVSAFMSVSAEPPLIVVAIDKRNSGHEMLEMSDAVFAVNILTEDQSETSNTFAWGEGDRFAGGDWKTAVTGAPVLNDALAYLDCTIYSRQSVGSHTLYIGEVQASSVNFVEGKPLVYWNRGYQSVQLIPKE